MAGTNLDTRSSNRGKTPLEMARDKNKFDVVGLIQHHIRQRSKLKSQRGLKVANNGVSLISDSGFIKIIYQNE